MDVYRHHSKYRSAVNLMRQSKGNLYHKKIWHLALLCTVLRYSDQLEIDFLCLFVVLYVSSCTG